MTALRKNIGKIFATFFLLSTYLLTSHTYAGEVLDRIKSRGEVTIGYRHNTSPFSYQDADGTVIGYSIDACKPIVKAIEKELNMPLKIKYRSVISSDRIKEITEGLIDLECATSTNSADRRKLVSFGLAYFYAGTQLLAHKDAGISSFRSLVNKKLGLVKGTTSDMVLESRKRAGEVDFEKVYFPSVQAAVKALEEKQVDAVLYDDILLASLASKSKQALTLVGRTFTIEPLSLMFSKSDARLNEVVINSMKDFYKTGEMQNIYKKWFLSKLPVENYNLNMPLSPLLKDNFQKPSGYTTDWILVY